MRRSVPRFALRQHLQNSMQSTTTNPAIPTETPEQVYKRVAGFLKAHAGQNIEFEILPSGFPLPPGSQSSVLQDGSSLGIPKKTLAQAFIVARQILFSGIETLKSNEIYTEDVLAASAIILLFDPEHTTACNYRKKHILSLEDPTTIYKLSATIQAEIALLGSLQTSPLHRHTKSPTLWYHRWWIAKNFFNYFYAVSTAENDGAAMYLSEFRLVLKAGERHPKNYYAWDYARRLFRLFAYEGYLRSYRGIVKIMVMESTEGIHAWCLSHADDISGWSFLLFLMGHHLDEGRDCEIVRKTLDLALKFGWAHESLWVFVRTLVASKTYISSSRRVGILRWMRAEVDKLALRGLNGVDMPLDQENIWSGSRNGIRNVLGCAIIWVEHNWQEGERA